MTDLEKKIAPPDMVSTHNSPNSIPDDSTSEHNDLADIIRCAMTKIKIGQYNDRSRKSKRKCKFPCSVCNKNCNENQQSIFWPQCTNWVHRKCNGTAKDEFIFSFGYISKSEMLDLFCIDMLSQLAMLLSYTVCSK